MKHAGEARELLSPLYEWDNVARDLADHTEPPPTDAFTVESFDVGEVVAHAWLRGSRACRRSYDAVAVGRPHGHLRRAAPAWAWRAAAGGLRS